MLASVASLDAKRAREATRRRQNERPVSERLERARAIFLRLALCCHVKPGKRSSQPHRMLHLTLYGVQVTPADVYGVAAELYGRGPAGLNPVQPALDLFNTLTTERMGAISPRACMVACRMADQMAREARRREDDLRFHAAFGRARAAVAGFFADLKRAA